MSTPRNENPELSEWDMEMPRNNKFHDPLAAPLEPTLEENHHWKWFREIGQKLCPQIEQQWHKDDPHICRPCEFAKKVAELYAAAVSKNLQEEVTRWLIRSDRKSVYGYAYAKEGELVCEVGGLAWYDTACILRNRLETTESRILELEKEITALREKP